MKTLYTTSIYLFLINVICIIPLGIMAVKEAEYEWLFCFTLNTLGLIFNYTTFILAYMLRYHNIWFLKAESYDTENLYIRIFKKAKQLISKIQKS